LSTCLPPTSVDGYDEAPGTRGPGSHLARVKWLGFGRDNVASSQSAEQQSNTKLPSHSFACIDRPDASAHTKRMTAQILAAELGNLIQDAKRKNTELRNAAEAALKDLKSLSNTSEAQLSAGEVAYCLLVCIC
jgi:hypothetical protein